jgi:hypothetical protein
MHACLAYFDPGSGSLLVQALVGGAAGVFVFAKYLWETVRSHDRRRWKPAPVPIAATLPPIYAGTGGTAPQAPTET